MPNHVTLNGFRFNKVSVEFDPKVHARSFTMQVSCKVRYRLPQDTSIAAILLEVETHFFSEDKTTMNAIIDTQGEFVFSAKPANWEEAIQHDCMPLVKKITEKRLHSILQTMDFQEEDTIAP